MDDVTFLKVTSTRNIPLKKVLKVFFLCFYGWQNYVAGDIYSKRGHCWSKGLKLLKFSAVAKNDSILP